MGIDHSAYLGYGVKITNKTLIRKMGEDELDVKGDFDTVWAGSAYSGDMETFVCIKKSVICADVYDNLSSPIKLEKLAVQPDWYEKILAWCKEYGQDKPKIGWWLCCLES